jgi:hypothetical protein
MTNYINSIQQVSITISSGTSNTATINSVTTANAIIIYGGSTTASTTLNSAFAGCTLTNSTTVTATVATSGSATTVVCTVVEFTSAAVNVSAQYGTVALGSSATTNTATITSVNTSFAAVFPLGMTNNTSANDTTHNYSTGSIAMTNGTTITATRGATGGSSTLTFYFCVIEFASALIQSIQHRSFTSTSSTATTVNDTISSVTTANTMLAYNGRCNASANPSTTPPDAALYFYGSLTSSTNVAFTRGVGTSDTFTIAYDVVEFKSGILNSSVQRGTVTLNNVTSNTASISSINPSYGFVNFVGYDTAATTFTQTDWNSDIVLTNATTLTAALNNATANPTIVSYEVLEFAFPASSVNSGFFGLF